MKACVLIREMPLYRRDSFVAGLQKLGYTIHSSFGHKVLTSPDDVLVIWNRYGNYDRIARQYEMIGARVIIAENGYLGRDFLEGHWYALARGFHNGGGWWPEGSFKRWESFGINVEPWKRQGDDILVLATRHIGPEGVKEPHGWAQRMVNELQSKTKRKVRLRMHPGEKKPLVTLEEDLRNVWACVTWGSGAALKSIVSGVPVFYAYPKWIGAQAASLLTKDTDLEHRFLYSPYPMLHKLAWAMWSTKEIETGEPFKCLLK